MPLNQELSLPTTEPRPDYLTLQNFKRGVITLVDKSRLPRNALEIADNLFLTEDGQPTVRPGVGWYGNTINPQGSVTSTRTNLVTNPSFETDTTGVQTYIGTFSQSSAQAYSGSNSVEIVNNASPTGGYYGGIRQDVSGLTASTTYTISYWVYSATAQDINLYVSAPANENNTVSVPANEWTRVSVTFVAGDVTEPVYIRGKGASLTWYVDAVLCEEASTAEDYFDGATTDITASNETNILYSWTGTAHASTSTESTYAAAAIDGFDYFDTGTTVHLVVAAGGTIYRSTDDGETWEACSGGSYTSGTKTNFNQNGGFLYVTNGVDNIIRYDGTTTLQTYTALTTPSAPSVAETGLTGTGYSYYYKIAAVNNIGYSAASAASTEVQATLDRSSWDATTDYVTLTLPAFQTSQTRFDIYISENDIDYFYLGSSSSTTFIDDGTNIPNPVTKAPDGNTTQGPKVEELVNIGSRQYGIRDADNPYRIWFSGAGSFSGTFSSAFDGGYLDWQEGGKHRPVKAVDYRDGKGTPYATIWCDSADGQGTILQMALETLTVADISITVPSAYQLPGSRGTPAPGSVVNVLNDYYFYNSQAFYNLGSRPNLQQILSTDEMSSDIRPTVKQINKAAEENIASIYYDAKIYFSVPYGSTENNYTAVFDTERRAWLPRAFTIGFSKFLRYSDTSKNQRLLAFKPGDTRLSEISSAIQGDYGVKFKTILQTGLYPVSKNRFEFQWTEEGEVEFSNPRGSISVDLLGVERTQGFTSSNTATVQAVTTNTGWNTFAWDTTDWDDVSDTPDLFSESTVKRYFNVQKELNAVQWRITTDSLDGYYVLRTLQTWGTPTFAGKPRSWRIEAT